MKNFISPCPSPEHPANLTLGVVVTAEVRARIFRLTVWLPAAYAAAFVSRIGEAGFLYAGPVGPLLCLETGCVLAALYLGGRTALVAALGGTFAAHLVIAAGAGTGPRSIAIATVLLAIVAVSVAATAAVNAVLTRQAAAIRRPAIIAAIVAVSGPGCALIGAVCAPLALAAFRVVPNEWILSAGLHTWVWQTIGGAALAPAACMWAAMQRQHEQAVNAATLRPLVLTVAAGVAAFAMLVALARADFTFKLALFEDLAAGEVESVTGRMRVYAEILHSLRTTLETQQEIHVDEFNDAAERYLKRRPSIASFTWIRHVKDPERLAFEAQMRERGVTDFAIHDPDAAATPASAAARADYYVVTMESKRDAYPPSFGLDLQATPQLSTMLERARSADRVVMSSVFKPRRDSGDQVVMLVLRTDDVTNVWPDMLPDGNTSSGFVGITLRPRLLLGGTQKSDDYAAVSAAIFQHSSTAAAPVPIVGWGTRDWRNGNIDPRLASVAFERDYFGQTWQLQFVLDEAHSIYRMEQFSLLSNCVLLFAMCTAVFLILVEVSRSVFLATVVEETRRAVRASERRYRQIFESVGDGMLLVDATGVIQSVNPAAAELLEYPQAELVGANIIRFISPVRAGFDAKPRSANDVDGHSADAPDTAWEGVGIARGGTNIPLYLSLAEIDLPPTDGDAGLQHGYVYAMQDLTMVKNAEKSYQRSRKMEAIGRLSGGVAHDFNNILGIVLGNLQILKADRQVDADGMERIDTAIRHVNRGAKLTRRLLQFTRTQQRDPQPVNVNELIEGMSDVFEASLGANIEIALELESGLPPALASHDDLQDALINLVLNAKDAMPSGGRLRVATHSEHCDPSLPDAIPVPAAGDYVVITVADSGCGMSAAVLEHVFEPFFTTKQMGEGTGMGLAMVYGFVTREDGYIQIDSQPGAGTSVSIRLPRSAPDRARLAVVSETTAVPRGDEAILVVDDEPDLLEVTGRHLADLGYRPTLMSSPMAAWDLLSSGRERFAMLLTDVVMSGDIDGLELGMLARRLQPDIRVLLITGFSEKRLLPDGEELRFPMIEKPFTRHTLAEKVREVLDAPRIISCAR